MKKLYLCTLIIASVITGCKTTPVPQPEEPPREKETPVPIPVQEEPVLADNKEDEQNFNPAMVTHEEFETTKVEVQTLIFKLNNIIRARNYSAWVSNLDETYFEEISSPEFLKRMSNHPRLKTQKIILSGPEDYFIYVVVPARDNDRVDDIEFITRRRVKAFTDTPKGERLRLYDLEKANEGWKIIN